MSPHRRRGRAFQPTHRIGLKRQTKFSDRHLETCAKLNRALAEIQTWLDMKRQSGRFSHGFLVELSVNSVARSCDIHAIYDEIGKLEGIDTTPSLTKGARKLRRPPLGGVWHKHYFEARNLVRNLKDQAEQMYTDGRWEAMFAPHHGNYLHEFMPRVLHEISIGAYARRARERRITGEFIVFERQADGSNYYLTLGKHGEWDAIRARIDQYKVVDAGSALP